MVKPISDFLPESLQNDIIAAIDNDDFPWFYINTISPDHIEEVAKDFPTWDESKITTSFGLTHVPFEVDHGINSDFFPIARTILYFLEQKENFEIKELIRIRIRRTHPVKGHTENHYNLPHVDYWNKSDFTTFVYYVDDSDGDTIVFDQKHVIGSNASEKEALKEIYRSTPKKGCGLLFDGLQYHAGNNPINYTYRTIINFDFYKKE